MQQQPVQIKATNANSIKLTFHFADIVGLLSEQALAVGSTTVGFYFR